MRRDVWLLAACILALLVAVVLMGAFLAALASGVGL